MKVHRIVITVMGVIAALSVAGCTDETSPDEAISMVPVQDILCLHPDTVEAAINTLGLEDIPDL
ncbi:hypothetical protein GCM10009720_08690 [Yaniella flava]|uniref:Uncharacterized protein n=1 Tax=Yaniella flava TaxID=287930 RepID=A0ABP5FNI8_9MICC|nr:hypothetical protein [Micrococcaceae bacterium]